MKEVKAYIKPICASRVIKDLEDAGAKDLTLLRVDAIAPATNQASETEAAFSKHITRYSEVAKLELVCRDEEARLFVEIIRARAHTGSTGDGRIFVSKVEEAVNIRNGETDDRAI